jgi:alpha-L-rhamnosidase
MLRGGAHGYEPATTLWELWDADVQGPSMNSRNHIMFGSVGSWLYKWLVGITPLTPGFTRTAIRPAGIGVRNLTYANASVHSPQGQIRTAWRLDTSTSPPTLSISISIPIGSAASVAVPLRHSGTITEGGAPVFRDGAFVPGVEGVAGATASSSDVHLEVASGQYQFVTS